MAEFSSSFRLAIRTSGGGSSSLSYYSHYGSKSSIHHRTIIVIAGVHQGLAAQLPTKRSNLLTLARHQPLYISF